MATAKMIVNITEKISTYGPGTPEADALKEILVFAKQSCISQTSYLSQALNEYSQIKGLLNRAACTVHWSTFDFAGRIAMGDFLDDSLTDLLGTNPTAALNSAISSISSACNMINGLLNFVEMMKNFMLQIYNLLDFLKGLGDFSIDCNFSDLITLMSQTIKFNPLNPFPGYMEYHLEKSERLLSKLFGNKSNGTPSIKSLSEVQLTRYPTEDITLSDILAYSKVHVDSLAYDEDFSYMYDVGIRYDQELADMQSRLVNGLVAEAGDIGTTELQTQGTCSLSEYSDKDSCLAAGGVWTLNADLVQMAKKTPRTWYAEEDSDFMNPDISAGDFLEDKRNGSIYIRSHELLPELFTSLMVQGFVGAISPYHYVLDTKSKKGDSAFITLQDIPELSKTLSKARTDYENAIYKKTLALSKYTAALSKAAEIGTSPAEIQEYISIMNSYDLRSSNISSLFEVLDNNPNKIGKLRWIIEAGEIAIFNKSSSFTKNDGIVGDITLNFPLMSYDYDILENNEIINSHEMISTDITKPNSFNYHLKQFYDEFKNFDEYIIKLSDTTIVMEQLYNDFVLKNKLSDELYYGITKNYNFIGKGDIRIGDAKVYLAFSKPHMDITNEVPNNFALNLFHGDVWLNITNYKVYMYLRLLGSSDNYYTYEWKEVGTSVQVFRDINLEPITEVITLDAAVFQNIDSKTNTYSSNDGILPSINWNAYQSWLNVGDIWLDSSNTISGIVQKVYIHNGTDFVWTPLLSNNPPIIAPVIINASEDLSITGNMLDGVFDIEGDDFYLHSVKINNVDILTHPIDTVEVVITGLGLLRLIGNSGDYYFDPYTNVNGSFSFSYTLKDEKGASSVSLWTIYVSPVNDRPSISGPINVTYPASDTVKKTIDLLQNASDPESDALSVGDLECITDNAGQNSGVDKFKFTDEIILVTPSYYKDILKRNETETIIFSYSVTDGYSPKAYTGMTINVTGINHPPVLNNSLVVYNYASNDSANDILLSNLATDFDGDVLNFSNYVKYTDPENALTKLSTKLVVDPTKYINVLKRGQIQTITAEYKADDLNGGLSPLGNIQINITGINHVPTITQDITKTYIKTGNVDEIDMLEFAVDFDDDVLNVYPSSISIVGNDVGISISNNVVTVTPTAYNAITVPEIITISYKVIDEVSELSNFGNIVITINPS